MKVTIESTPKITRINGVPARIWQGHTERGIPVIAFLTRIAARDDADLAEFEADLQEHAAPTFRRGALAPPHAHRGVMMTAREHLDWCINRAMEYANRGDMTQAWASFGSDVCKHEGTAFIARHELFGMEMLRQTAVGAGAREFRDFISGWAVGE